MNPNQDYTNLGYDITLTKSANLQQEGFIELDPLQFEQSTPEFSGSKLTGLIQSKDNRIKLDLDNNTLIISDGVVERIRLGKQSDDSYGFILKDKNGNILLQFNDLGNLIQSPDQNSKLDFDNNNYTVSENGIPRLIIGFQQNGF